MDSAAGTTSSGRGVTSGAVKKASAVMSSMRASLFCRLANTSSVLASACSVIVAGLAVGGADTAGATGATDATRPAGTERLSEEEATAVVSNPLRRLRELRIGEGCFFCTVVLFVHSTPAPCD